MALNSTLGSWWIRLKRGVQCLTQFSQAFCHFIHFWTNFFHECFGFPAILCDTFFPVYMFNWFKSSARMLVSLNRSWQSNKGTFRASGVTRIEPIPSESEWLEPAFALAQLRKGGGQEFYKIVDGFVHAMTNLLILVSKNIERNLNITIT